MTLTPQFQARMTRYEVSCLSPQFEGYQHLTLYVEYRSDDLWAVVWPGHGCLSASGGWSYEPTPSNRDENWLREHRFPLKEALRRAGEKAPQLTVNGHTVLDVLEMERQEEEMGNAAEEAEPHPAEEIYRAARILEDIIDDAPYGPYELDDHTNADGTRCLLAADGNPIAHIQAWSGGISRDRGSIEQTAASLSLWDPHTYGLLRALLHQAYDALIGTQVDENEPALALARKIIRKNKGEVEK